MRIIYCQDCEDHGIEAEYFWKDGKDLIPVCQSCAERWALEQLVDNNEVIEFSNIEDDEMEEYEKKYGKEEK